MVSFSTLPSAFLGLATGSLQKTLPKPTFLAGSPSHRPLLPPSNAFLHLVRAGPLIFLIAFPMLSSSQYCCMAPTSTSPPGVCLQIWRYIGARFNDGL